MRFSSAPLLLALALSASGCAVTVRHGTEPSGAGAAPVAGDDAAPPSTSKATPAADGGRGTPAAPPSGRLDPSERITPEELASIPDPVPGSREVLSPASGAPSGTNSALKGSAAPPMNPVAPAGSQAASGAEEGASVPAASGWVWRVQVFASESAADAERVSREAAARLRAEAVVALEGTLYKVRLGGFATESEAQSLRERAIAAGYAGAFRTKTH